MLADMAMEVEAAASSRTGRWLRATPATRA